MECSHYSSTLTLQAKCDVDLHVYSIIKRVPLLRIEDLSTFAMDSRKAIKPQVAVDLICYSLQH